MLNSVQDRLLRDGYNYRDIAVVFEAQNLDRERIDRFFNNPELRRRPARQQRARLKAELMARLREALEALDPPLPADELEVLLEEYDGRAMQLAVHVERERGEPGLFRSCQIWDANPVLVRHVSRGHERWVRLALAAGANPNVGEDGLHRLPLHVAAEQSQLGSARLLLEAGADVGALDAAGRTALHAAVQEGSEELIELLLEAGADVNAQDRDGHTPLIEAASSGRDRVTAMLLRAGADPALATHNGATAAQVAVGEAARVLSSPSAGVGRAAPAPSREVGQADAELQYAAHVGDAALVSAALAAGACVDVRDGRGETPLMYAARYDFAEAAGVLISAGAAATLTGGESGMTAAEVAARFGAQRVSGLLGSAGAGGSGFGGGGGGGGGGRSSRASRSRGDQPRRCVFFAKGQCRYGRACRFSHTLDSSWLGSDGDDDGAGSSGFGGGDGGGSGGGGRPARASRRSRGGDPSWLDSDD